MGQAGCRNRPDLFHGITGFDPGDGVGCGDTALQFDDDSGGIAKFYGTWHLRLSPIGKFIGGPAAGGKRVGVGINLHQFRQQVGGRLPINGNKFVANIEGIGSDGQQGSADKINEHFAIVDVDIKGQFGGEAGRVEIGIVSVVQAADVFGHDLVELQIVLGNASTFHPRGKV